jgi:predicted RNase H-like nuclease (RuvC/YqgF family)
LQKAKAKLKGVEKNIKLQTGGRKLQVLQVETEKLTVQIANLKKKQKEELEKYTELEIRKTKELSVISKQLEEETKKCRHLENKVETFRKKLDRKTEEVSDLAKKSRDIDTIAEVQRSPRKSIVRLPSELEGVAEPKPELLVFK